VFVQPSGLIFLVVIAIWAAYLLQHWVGRREHLATARSVDRFSEAMRVLERRTPLPESDLSLPQPRSYSVSPARPSRAEVVVKRAQPPAPNVQPRRPPTAAHQARASDAKRGLSARRVRGLSLLVSSSLVVVVSTLAAFYVLPRWSVVVVVAELVVDLVWLRHAAATARAVRSPRSRMRPADTSVAPARRLAPRAKAWAPRYVATSTRPASRPAVQVEPMVAAPACAAEIAEPAESAAESPAEVDLSGWAPVPVPPPTYTLKAKAERSQPVAAAVSEPTATEQSSFGGLVDEGELDELLDRRHA
jgi:hypothetical protein